jgi:hypothetical protein
MRVNFRFGLLIGLAASLVVGSYCVWLWQQERQILRHSENLLQRIEQKNWSGVADLIADDYVDQWGQDRALVLERMRLVFGYTYHFRIKATGVDGKIDNGAGGSGATSTGKRERGREPTNGVGFWRGTITIEGDDAELIAIAKERVNSLRTPFELQWLHVSRKPWDWKLVRVSNPELEIPAGFD